ncbi:MAG: hypothetical protein WCQ03_09110, partial [Phycisphaerae bacterium]
ASGKQRHPISRHGSGLLLQTRLIELSQLAHSIVIKIFQKKGRENVQGIRSCDHWRCMTRFFTIVNYNSVCPFLDSANCAAKLYLTHSPYRSPSTDDVHQGRVLLFLNFAGFS